MAAFEYTALDTIGHENKGVLEADSARMARQQLRDQGLLPLQIAAVATRHTKSQNWLSYLKPKRHLSSADLALLTRQLATLVAAGIPLEECLTSLAQQTEKAKLQAVILAVRSRVLEGHSLAQAMSQVQLFPRLYQATVAAGEQSGKLDQVLERLADYIEQQHDMQQKIRQALIYPAVMLLISSAIVAFLLVSVVPKMVAVFEDAGQGLPVMTQILLAISGFLQHDGMYVLVALAVAFLGMRYVLRQHSKRYAWHGFLLRLPLLKKTLRVINTTRFVRTFGILFGAGVPVNQAMSVAANVMTLLPMQEATHNATERVQEGMAIHKSLRNTGYFTPMSLQLITSGENSGELVAMLQRVADQQDRDMRRFIDVSLKLFEPLLIIIMGSVVLFIVMAILLPIFDMQQLVSL